MIDFNFVLIWKDGAGGSRKIKANDENSAYKKLINGFDSLPPKIIISLAEPLNLEDAK